MRRLLLFVAVLWCLAALSGVALAAEYHVGPGQQYATLNDLLAAVTLTDGDIAWIHPGTYGPVTIDSGGGSSEDSPAEIRAWDMNDKPVFDAGGADNCIEIESGPEKWYKLVGLEETNSGYRGIYHLCGGLILEDCYIHDNAKNGIMTSMCGTRDDAHARLIVEHCELSHNGSGTQYHSWYLQEYWVKARYNWTHDANGGIGYKDRSRESLLEYNLIEPGPNGAGCAISFCGWDDDQMPDVGQTATMTGNVVTKNGGGNHWLFINNIRMADGGNPDHTKPGYLYMYNNTFYTENHSGPMFADDEASIWEAHNNIFYSTSCDQIYDQVDAANGPGQVNTSYNNWVKTGMSVPSAFTDTVSGTDPGVVNAATSGGDFHLTSGSPCIDAGRNGLDVVPDKEYEHPCDYTDRPSDGHIDIGAYEYSSGGAQPPVADFTGNPTSGTAPLTVNFTDQSTNSPTSWSWDFGDSNTSTAQNPSHEYTSVGTYTVSLTATNSAGSDTATKNDYISVTSGVQPPVADFTGSPTSGAAPLTVNFTDQSTNNPTSWSWDFGDSNTSTAQNPSHEYTSVGTYTVSLTATNSGGSDTETKTDYISVSEPAPVADFTGSPTSGTAPLTVNFTDQSTNNPTSWSWDFGDSNTSTAQNPSHEYTSAGDYTVSLTATNSGGSDTATKNDYISVTSGGGTVTIFSDDFEASFSGWTESGTPDWYTGSPKNGTHSIRLRTTESIERTISTSGYQNITVSFYLGANSLDNNNENVQALWYDGSTWTVLKQINNGDAEEDNALHSFSYTLPAGAEDNTVFALKFKINGSGTGDYGYVDDVVVEGEAIPPTAPSADFTGSPTAGQATLTVDFTDLSKGAPTSWSWNFGDSNSSAAQNPSHDYTASGDYTVSLTATNAQGNDTATKTDYVHVAPSSAPDTIYSDDFESGISDWTSSGDVNWHNGSPCNGSYSAQLLKVGSIEQTISTAGYEYIKVSFYLGANSLDNANENVQALWSANGTDWTVLKQIDNGDPEEDNALHYFEYWLPASADDDASFALKFKINGSGTKDYGYVDDVVVAGFAISGAQAPVADFTGNPTSGAAPLTVNFTDQSTNSPTSWSWDFGDSNTSTAQNPSHEYTSSGTYTVSLTATNSAGSDTETKNDYISVTSGGQEVTIYSDTFTSLDGWTTTNMSLCECDDPEVSYARFRGPDPSMERTISTVGYTNIKVHFDIELVDYAPLESGEYMQVLWYDGSTWTELVRLTDTDPHQWYVYDFDLPASANNNPDFALKFFLSADNWDDEAHVDVLTVKGTN